VSLTSRDIAEITRLLEESTFDELELEIDGLKIHLRRSGTSLRATPPAPGRVSESSSMPAPATMPTSPAEQPGLTAVRAPLLGTFYRAPKPGAPPFIEAGARVEPDSIIGIIEVMKLMNTVRAGIHGLVREIRARDGALVEYGETLLTVAQES
jgi:acetyl-CoA carboxylase biotin carboxyl carrier protein